MAVNLIRKSSEEKEEIIARARGGEPLTKDRRRKYLRRGEKN